MSNPTGRKMLFALLSFFRKFEIVPHHWLRLLWQTKHWVTDSAQLMLIDWHQLSHLPTPTDTDWLTDYFGLILDWTDTICKWLSAQYWLMDSQHDLYSGLLISGFLPSENIINAPRNRSPKQHFQTDQPTFCSINVSGGVGDWTFS